METKFDSKIYLKISKPYLTINQWTTYSNSNNIDNCGHFAYDLKLESKLYFHPFLSIKCNLEHVKNNINKFYENSSYIEFPHFLFQIRKE